MISSLTPDPARLPSRPAERDARAVSSEASDVSPGDIAVGVVIGRTAEYFDYFVYGIASVLVFPLIFFPFETRLDGTLLSFVVFSFAFIARPIGTVVFMEIQRRWGRGTKLTVALFVLGTSTVGIAFLPGYGALGYMAIVLLAVLRVGQGIALGGSWDGLPSLLALCAPRHRRGWYAMMGQLGAPVGFMIASDGLSPIKPPWTSLTAYDLNEGVIKWKIALGDAPGIKGTGTPYPKVGPVITAGGLLFTGTRDKKVRAFDVETGKQIWEFEVAAMLSQIGFVTIPPGVIQKARAGQGLSGQEKDMLNQVPTIGAELLSNIPRLETVAKIVLYQNKNYDGSGFPVDSVAGEDIPSGSRILKVLLDLLQLETKETPKAAALGLMQNRTGLYDPRVLDAAFACFDVYLPQATSAKSSGRPVGFKDLQPGHILISDVETSDGMMIVTAGNKISPLLLQKLRNFAAVSGIKEPIYVEA
jgi:hypothetical protein